MTLNKQHCSNYLSTNSLLPYFIILLPFYKLTLSLYQPYVLIQTSNPSPICPLFQMWVKWGAVQTKLCVKKPILIIDLMTSNSNAFIHMYITANRKFPKKWIVSSVLHLQCYVVTNDSSYESYGMTHRLPHLSLMPLERTPMLLEAKIRKINLKIKKKLTFLYILSLLNVA